MGAVYRARDPQLDREVALKTISQEVLAHADSKARFQREARAAARLQHPNIVTVYELGEVDGIPFIAMELLEGLDLAEAMKTKERFSLLQLVGMVVAVCRGLDFAHKNGVIHRDVKPANIRVCLDGSVKLVDFGIAHFADSEMTQTGVVLGTPSYVAPEVLKTGRVDHRADMWAAGVLLYELLAGVRPFQGDIPTLIYRIVHQPHPQLDAAAMHFPAGLAAVVDKALAKAPAERFRDLAEMADVTELAAGLSGPVTRQISAEDRAAAFAQNLFDAKRLLAGDEYEGALAAARRAQALDPSRTDIVALVEDIERRIDTAPTVSAAVPEPKALASLSTPPASSVSEASGASEASMSMRLRGAGAGAFREVASFGEPPASQIARLSPVRDHLAVAGADGAVRIWDLRSRVKAAELRTQMHQRMGHDARILTLEYSPDGSLVAAGHVDGYVHLWDVESGQELPCRLKHEGLVSAVSFAPDAAVLASGGPDSNVKLWDVEAARRGETRRTLVRQPAPVSALAYGGEGRWLASGHGNRVLRIVDAASLRLIATLRGPRAPVSFMLSSGDRLIVASQDRSLRLYDVPAREQLLEIGTGAKPVIAASLSDATDVLATVALDNCVRFWDLQSGQELAALWGASGESFAGIATRGASITVCLADGRIRLWQTE